MALPEDILKENDNDFFDYAGDILAAPFRGAEGAVQGAYNLADYLSFDVLPDYDTRFLGTSKTMAGGAVEGISQFATGFFPLFGLAGRVGALAKAGDVAQGVVAGAVTDFTFFNGQEARLSNLIQQVPELQNPVTEFLAHDADEGELEGRMKNVLEGLGLEAVVGVFIKSLKAMKNMREGKGKGENADEVNNRGVESLNTGTPFREEFKLSQVTEDESFLSRQQGQKEFEEDFKEVGGDPEESFEIDLTQDYSGIDIDEPTPSAIRLTKEESETIQAGGQLISETDVAGKVIKKYQLPNGSTRTLISDPQNPDLLIDAASIIPKERTDVDFAPGGDKPFFVYSDGKQLGPFNREQVQERLDSNVFKPTDKIAQAGDQEWVDVSRVLKKTDEVVEEAPTTQALTSESLIQEQKEKWADKIDSALGIGKPIKKVDPETGEVTEVIAETIEDLPNAEKLFDIGDWTSGPSGLTESPNKGLALLMKETGITLNEVHQAAKREDQAFNIRMEGGPNELDEGTWSLLWSEKEFVDLIENHGVTFEDFQQKLTPVAIYESEGIKGGLKKKLIAAGYSEKQLKDIANKIDKAFKEMGFDFFEEAFPSPTSLVDLDFKLGKIGPELKKDFYNKTLVEGVSSRMQTGKPMTAREAIQDLSDRTNGNLGEYSPIVKKLLALGKDTGIDAKLEERSFASDVPTDSKRGSFYESGKRRIVLDGQSSSVKENPIYNLLHEATHAVTVDNVNKHYDSTAFKNIDVNDIAARAKAIDKVLSNKSLPKPIAEMFRMFKKADAMRDEIASKGKLIGTPDLYWIKNPAEFMSMAFSDPQLQQALKGIQYTPKMTMWEKVVNTVKSFFGRGVSTDLADNIVSRVGEIAEMKLPSQRGRGVDMMPEDIPLGLKRSPFIDPNLTNIGDDAFDAIEIKTRKELDKLEEEFDGFPLRGTEVDAPIEFKRKLATAQDAYSAVELEKFRRQIEGEEPWFIASEFRMLAGGTQNAETVFKLALLGETVKKRGIQKELFGELDAKIGKDENAREVFEGQLKKAQEAMELFKKKPKELGVDFAPEGVPEGRGVPEFKKGKEDEFLSAMPEKFRGYAKELMKEGKPRLPQFALETDGDVVVLKDILEQYYKANPDKVTVTDAVTDIDEAIETTVRAQAKEGEDAEKVLRDIRITQQSYREQGKALIQNVSEIAQEAKDNGYGDVAITKLKNAFQQLLTVADVYRRIGRETAITLQARNEGFGKRKLGLNEAESQIEGIRNEFVNNSGNMKPERMVKLVREHIDPNDLEGSLARLLKTAKKAQGKSFLDMPTEYWMNSILSGPKTQMVNIMGNALTQVMTTLEVVAGGVASGNMDVVKAVIASWSDSEMFKEAGKFAKKSFKDQENILDPANRAFEEGQTASITGQRLQEGPLGSMVSDSAKDSIDKYAHYIRLPGRLLLTSDEFFKQLAYRRAARMKAAMSGLQQGIRDPKALAAHINKTIDGIVTEGGRMMSEEGLVREASIIADKNLSFRDPRLAAQEKAAFIKEYVDKNFNPDASALIQYAAEEAQYLTFTKELQDKTLGKVIQDARNKLPYLRFVVPFVRTPTNILKFAFERTPFVVVLKEERERLLRELNSDDPILKARSRGKIVTAGLTFGGLIDVTFNNREYITGGGPSNEREKEALMATGWRPYSIKIGDTYYSYQRLDPIATPLGLVADLVETGVNEFEPGSDEGLLEHTATSMMLALTRNSTNKSYLAGIQMWADALGDPDRYIEKLGRNYAGSLVPNLISQMSDYDTQPMREARSVMDVVKRKLGLRGGLDVKRNVLGEEYQAEQWMGTGFINPIRMSTAKDDPVLTEMASLNHAFRTPEPTLGGQINLLEYENEKGQSANDRQTELLKTVKLRGLSLRQTLNKLVKSKNYQRLSPESEPGLPSPRIEQLNTILTKYRKEARRQMLREYPELNAQYSSLTQARAGLKGGMNREDVLELLNK